MSRYAFSASANVPSRISIIVSISWSADEPPLVPRQQLQAGFEEDLPSFSYRFSPRALHWRSQALLEGYGAAVLGLFSVPATPGVAASSAAPTWSTKSR